MLAGGELSWVWMLEGGELFCIYEGKVCNIVSYWFRIEAKVAFIDIIKLAPVEAILIKFVKLVKFVDFIKLVDFVELIELIKLNRILRVYSFY